MYEHIFFRNAHEKQAKFFNIELKSGIYESLEKLAGWVKVRECHPDRL